MNGFLKIYRQRMGIEAMFKDCKSDATPRRRQAHLVAHQDSGGYNLEGSRANEQRLTNLILLIALAYTASVIKGKSIKNSGSQKYVARLSEAQINSRRHSNFWLGLYGSLWIIAWDFLANLIENMMNLTSHKLPYYQRGLKAMSILQIA